MTCENCIHNNLIKTEASSFCLCSRAFEMTERRKYDPDIECEYFMDRSKVLYLPCKVGDSVYTIVETSCEDIDLVHTVCEFYKEGHEDLCTLPKGKCPYKYIVVKCSVNQMNILHFSANFGKTVFLTREEAEQALQNNKTESTKCEECKYFFKETMTCLNTDFCDYEEGCDKYDKQI